MARPVKNNCDYFPHDAGMRNHRKVKAIITKFGLRGYAIYSMLLETLTASDGFSVTISSPTEWELFSSDMSISTEEVVPMIQYFVTLGLIQQHGDEYRSDSLIERFESLLNKRIRSKKTYEERRQIEKQIGRKIQSTNGIDRVTRLMVFEKFEFKCFSCGQSDSRVLDVHHINPRHSGGTDDMENLQLLCANCHRKEHIGIVNDTETDFSVTETTQSKVKESKEKETRESLCQIFGKNYKAPQERMRAEANFFSTVDSEAEELLTVLNPLDAIAQIQAYVRYCAKTDRQVIGKANKLCETILSADWIKLLGEPPPEVPYKEAAFDKENMNPDAWENQYAFKLRTDNDFRKHFGYEKLPSSQTMGVNGKS